MHKIIFTIFAIGGSFSANSQMSWTLAHGAAEDNPRHAASRYFADRITKESGGKITITVSANSKSGDDAEVLRKVASGEIALTANSQGAVSQWIPEYAAFGLPYTFRSEYEVWRVLGGPVGRELADRSAAAGFVVLGFWDNGFRHITNSIKPIAQPSDLTGLRIRTPPDPVTQEFVRLLGGIPVAIPFSELPAALKDLKVDGQENPLTNIYTSKIYEFQQFLSLTSHKYELTPFLMSKKIWNQLDNGEKKLVERVAVEATQMQRSAMIKNDERVFSRLAQTSIKINVVYDTSAFSAAAHKLRENLEGSNIASFVKRLETAASNNR